MRDHNIGDQRQIKLQKVVYIICDHTWTNFSLYYTEKFRFSAEFIEMRRQALDIFVNRIASHHELQQSEDLRTFLQADEQVISKFWKTKFSMVCFY